VFKTRPEENSSNGGENRYSSWQTALADRKHECCQEVGLILSSKIQVEACISLPAAPVVFPSIKLFSLFFFPMFDTTGLSHSTVLLELS
jgi:hypothetical protein